MNKKLVLAICLFLFKSLEGEVYQDRPKIKTSDGDLIIEPAYDKNILLRPNGPKSSIFVGDVDILRAKSTSDTVNTLAGADDTQELVNGPNGILRRLEKLESKTLPLPNDLFLNISTIWRRVNNLQRKVNNLETINNNFRNDQCQSNPCEHGGTCLNLVNGYHCLCPANWEGKDCDIDVNECRNFLGTDLGCQHGVCINKPGYYECLCQSGWFGLHCTRTAKDCSGGDFEMCGHGTCLKVDSGEGVKCICHQGWTTNGTGVACLTDVNECESHQSGGCSVNPKVECINLPGSFRCGQCPRGYEGDGYTCTDIDECATESNGGCSPMVACHNTIGSRLCGPCPPGYQGDGVTCSWKGSCRINHGGCHPSAQCMENLSLGLTAQCICPEGMEGDGIGLRGCYISTRNDSESCANNPCGSHGHCHLLRSGYTCICQRGYGGSHCDVETNSCAVNPCHNSGICRLDDSAPNGFRCECTAQFSGPLCQVPSKTCGGFLDAEEGSIVYPLSNTTYSHNSKCAWVIHTVPSKVINVTFSKFSLESGVECSNDFLQIHDGRSSASQLLGRFCGNSFPMGGNIISSHNNLYFWFRSDPTVSKEGFALHWTSINPVCGGEVDATTHGHISSPGSPGKYPPNRDCFWKLMTALGKKIELHFFALDIEKHENCSFDYLAIYDGMRQSDPLLNKYCNSSQPAPILSAGPEMLIHFHSDEYDSGNGFQIAYAPAPGVPGCGGYFTSDMGEITAPSYNSIYLNNVICEYKIKTSPGTKVKINFKLFELERSFRCRFDYLKIYDGPSEESPLVGKFCGTTYPKSYVATSNMLFIRFFSDSSVSKRGFKIVYEAFCQQSFRGDSGVLKSPGYPFSYPATRVCEYVINTTPGKAIQLTFQDFDIEDGHQNCQYDNIEIRDGADANATLLGRYCGGSNRTPPVTISTHNFMYIRFKSDLSVSGTGFYANYTAVETECGGIYRETTGLINCPSNDSNRYKNNQKCTWILIAPEGMHVKLTWHRFELESTPSCAGDYLQLTEIDDDNRNYTMGKFCGTTSPPTFTTFTNRVHIEFKSDISLTSAGFSLSYTFLDEKSQCGGNYFRSHGFIYSPGWPSRYERNRDCTWIITVPIGQQIRMNISRFDLERPFRTSCNSGDFLEIKNGGSLNSPLIGQYCGRFQSRIITSLANTVSIRFHSDAYIAGDGFQLEWDGSVFGCGGTLTSSSGSISSPNYPNNYNENAECFYRIVTSLGSRIRITFTDLELERTVNCKDDYVEIYDGRDSDATSFGKYCNMIAALNNIETTTNYAYIKFRSDSISVERGFMLNYITICNNNLTGTYGVIESPDYPNSYPMRLNCLWTINVPKENKINVTFTHFNVFKHNMHYRYMTRNRNMNNTLCYRDYLQWKESKETKYVHTYCGMSLPPMIATIGNSLQIKFATGEFESGTGFRLEWVSYGCGGHIQKRYGTFSFDSRSMASTELECEWLIETPIGTSVSLVMSDLYLKASPNCTVDAVEIYNGQNKNYPLLTRICKNGVSSVSATANYMLVKLVMNSTLKGAYFTSTFSALTSTCGGNLQSLSGYIYSKNYPKNYENNLDCTWVISVPVGHRIQLNIMDLDLYSKGRLYKTSDDCDDSIKIFDNGNQYSPDSNYTHIICPRSPPGQFTTVHSTALLQFTSNSYGNAKGFKLNFSVTCGAYITAISDGIISNENYLGGSNNSCTWYIRAAQLDQKISLTITHLYLPNSNEIYTNRTCSSSYLRVYDGDNINAPLFDEYCGKHAPPMIVSRGSAITVVLGTYNDIVVGHFSAHYSSLNEVCGGTLTSEEGTIASPNYPRSYPIGANCEWTLNTSPGNKVYVVFERFNLEYSEGCNEDYLEIRRDNGGGPLLGVYCGNEIPTNTTVASQLYIKFHSNDKNSAKGFLFHYGFVHGNELINMDNGEIASPLYPHLYLGSAIYSWRIQARDTESITIRVNNLEIPSYGDVCNNYLSIYDGYDDTAPVLSQLCGKLPEPVATVQTSSNMAYIKLSLDDSNTGSQFHLTWTKANENTENIGNREKINCGTNYTELIHPGNFSIFTSPNFPENYDNDLICQWSFEATNGRHLILNFKEFALEETSRCFADYISVYTADKPGEWKPIKENICETEAALQPFTSTKYMKITFRADSSISKRGFRGQVSSTCGGLITDLSGEVGPTWDDTHVGNSMIYSVQCNWTIKVRPGRVINLDFTHFNISNKDDDCVSSVTLRNGDSVEAPILIGGKYCGYSHETRTQLTTSSNSVYISYVNVIRIYIRVGFQNFKIHYEEKGYECGATSKLDALDHSWEVIQSINYPLVPVPFSECIWSFSGPPGEILRIDFMDTFDLDNVDGCETEFVEIRDGLSNLSPMINRYCGEKPGTIKTTNNAMYVRYLTQLSDPRVGFKANVSIDICGGTIVAEQGELKSPGYPNMNLKQYGVVCKWVIRGGPTLVYNVIPLDVDLTESEKPCATKVTIEENIPGGNGTAILREFCYDKVDVTPIQTSTNEFVIRFEIEKPSEWTSRSQGKGFRFSFNSTRPICGGRITTREGFLTTPGYPLETVLRYCSWYIEIPDKTRRIRLELLDVDVNKHSISMYNDNLLQSNIQSISSPEVTSRVYESSGNKMLLFIWMKSGTTKHKFKAKFSSENNALCGGDLNGIHGEIFPPRLERSYSCEWYINSKTATYGDTEYKSILITAKTNSSVVNNRCRYGDPLLNIKSTISKEGLTISRDICGNAETRLVLPSSVVKLKATTGNSASFSYHIEWKSQPCGGLVSAGETAVDILSIPVNTNNTLDCAWELSIPNGERVELKMVGSFQYNCDNEYLKIKQGFSDTATAIGDYCKTQTLDNPLVISFMNVYIQYHTQARNISLSNVKLMVKTVTSQCGGQLTSPSSVFSSPNYPKSYEPNQECSWYIAADMGSRVSLSFIDRFVVEDQPNCTKDAVIIYDWKNDAYNEIVRLCGRQLPQPYNSTYNKMKVVLRTDDKTNMDGFRALWRPICGGKYLATTTVQMLYSPGFPTSYSPMENCTFEISAPDGKKLLVEFIELDIEGALPDCKYDNITIIGEDDYDHSLMYEVYCDNKLPPVISNYNKIVIKFKSDTYIQRRGFKLSYQIYECGGQVRVPTLLSSHRGDVYDTNLNCTWSIQAPADKLIVFKFWYIDLESHFECHNDYVAIYDGLSIEDEKRLALMCGHVNSTTILRSHGNEALIQFVTDQSYNFKGFKVDILFTYKESVGCGGRIDLTTTSTKTLKSPLLGNSVVYENYLDCQWSIVSPPDTVIKIEFTAFHISPCLNVNQTAIGISKCDCDLVEIADGLNPDSLKIGTYCGHILPPSLTSSHNLMGVRLSTDGELNSSGFVARITTQQSVCGQSHFDLIDKVARIKSPGFERGRIPRGLHCVYYFNPTDRTDFVLRLSILNLSLQPPYDHNGTKICNKDKLVVANNPITRNVSLGKDYIMTHVSDTFVSNNYNYYVDETSLPSRMEYCGSVVSSDIYVKGSMTLTLITSPDQDADFRGMDIEVELDGLCGRNYTGTQGKIQTSYNAIDYDSPIDCFTLITAPDNFTISAYFISVIPDYWNDNIYLNIYDGNNTNAERLASIKSDYETTTPVFGNGRYMLLHSHSSESDHISFDMNYVATDKGIGCGGKLQNELGRVTSPMYPKIYRQKSTCEWELETPVATRLKLHFETFDLGRSCDQNYIQLVDSKGVVISTYCSEKPADYTSVDNYVKIVFYTTMNNGGSGWVADFVGVI